MDFLSPKTYRLAQTGQVFYFAVSTQPGTARRLSGMPQPKQGMFGLGVANNINNTNNINFPYMPMCVGMHMDFLSPKTYRLAQTGQVFYFAVSTQPGTARRLSGMPQPKQGMFGLGVANNINNTNNINFPYMPMCVGMHMDFPYIRNPQACTDWKGIYFAVGEPAPSQPGTVRDA